jgi:long-subunit acyl-CoA synthetase (AMP-forming)
MPEYNPLLQSLSGLAQSNPDFVALYKKSRKVTAGKLFNRSISVASGLAARGFRKNDVAVIAAEPGEEFLEIMHAIILLQGKIAMIDPEMGRENYASKMQQLQPQWMFIDSRLLFIREHPILNWVLPRIGIKFPQISIFPGVRLIAVGRKLPIFRRHIFFRDLYKGSTHLPDPSPDGGISENIIIYTSGTLSVPKGVLHTGKSLEASIKALKNLLSADQNAIVGTNLPHFMLLGIASGIPVKMKKSDISPASCIRWLVLEKIGILFGPPSDYLPLIQYCEINEGKLPQSLRQVLIGSAPVHVQFLKRLIAVLPFYTKITCTYGMTENLLIATVDGCRKATYSGKGDLVGKPVAGVSLKIAEDGEIMVKSDQLFSRYFHEKKGKEWHGTGDLGEIDGQGNLILMGRKKEMIIRRNMNIYPALYENTIKHINGVEEAAMVGVFDEVIHDERVYLALEGAGLDIDNIQSLLKQGEHCIDREALPDHIFKMIIPRKGRQNKIDRSSIVNHIKKNRL